MEFAEVVMKRRAVRRFEEGGVDREVIERIARLAQRTPSAGFSQGQRLVIVTGAGRTPRGCLDLRGVARGTDEFGPWVRSTAPRRVHPLPQRSDLPPPLPGSRPQDPGGRERDRLASPQPASSTSGRRCRPSCWRRSTRDSAAGSSGTRSSRSGRTSAIPMISRPSGSCRSASTPRCPLAQPQARLGAVRGFRPRERWG